LFYSGQQGKQATPCPPELWPAFSALLDEALELSESERPRWLSALGAEHAAVRPWLVRVIASHGNTVAEWAKSGSRHAATAC
jgi:hypothetical protein